MIGSIEQFYSEIRDASLTEAGPLRQKDGKWEISERKRLWLAVSSRMFDTHLEKFAEASVEVLSEVDPELDLPAEERFAAKLKGKERKYSSQIRKGIVETIAMIGVSPESLSSCSFEKARATPTIIVRRVLQNADWKLWASLNDVLPTLAEGAPEEFLTQVEAALRSDKKPFQAVFSAESSGLTGRTYITGVLWALECLAWLPDFFVTSSILLAELASIDPGGNWSNRPANSLRDIFLPWHPQTLADFSQRKAALGAILREVPKVGWTLLLSLLPSGGGDSTGGTYKPKWLQGVPEEWKPHISQKDYAEQIKTLAAFAVDVSKHDLSKISDLVQKLPNLPRVAISAIVDFLGSEEVTSQPEGEKAKLWERLVTLVRDHRKFSDADWALEEEELQKIENVAQRLEPKVAELRFRHLFSVPDYQLFDTDSYELEQQKLNKLRETAVSEILAAQGIAGVLRFAESVVHPDLVGAALASLDLPDVEAALLPQHLTSSDKTMFPLTRSYVWARFRRLGIDWVKALLRVGWPEHDRVVLFCALPFAKEIWELAESNLANTRAYWEKVPVNVFHIGIADLEEAAIKLLGNGRPRSAVRALGRLLHEKRPIPTKLTVEALLSAAGSTEALDGLDRHVITEIIGNLQGDPIVERNDLIKIEWAYLPLLDRLYKSAPMTLERALASDPEFFSQMIQTVYNSEKEERKEEITAEKRAQAENGYKLLRGWEIPPGLKENGEFDPALLEAWFRKVDQITADSGHLKISLDRIGHVLVHVPPDPSGLWINSRAANILNGRDMEVMRRGFTSQLFNMRGVHGFTAGREEAELAKGYRAKADALDRAGFQRFAAELRTLAKTYEDDAERESKRGPLD